MLLHDLQYSQQHSLVPNIELVRRAKPNRRTLPGKLDVKLRPFAITRALMAAVPVADPRVEKARERIVVKGEVPSVLRPPSGCRFNPRCPDATDVCRTDDPPLRDLGGGRAVACHLHGIPITAAPTPRRSAT